MSSWLDRLAVLYGMNRKDLVGPHNLAIGGMYVPHHLDADPPPVMLTELAKRTGVDLATLQAMTLAGWALYLFDTPEPPRAGQAQKVFYQKDSQEGAVHMLLHGQPMPARPVPEPLARLERYTHTALTTGRVELPGRPVHAAIWFRLLRALLDEVSLALSSRRAQARATLNGSGPPPGCPSAAA